MADDQVKYSDLIVDDGAIDALDKRLDDIKKKMAEVKGEAATLTAETRNLSTATREQQQATSQNAAAAENLRQRMKGLTEEQKRLEAERRKYAKLTEEEANRVKTMSGVYQQYVQAVRNGTAAQMSELKALDLQNKSYNELYQTYNALKDALNQMTVAERQNTAAGQAMTNQAKEIRDTLNNLQQATGNYALNVGNYMSAFNGLQFQTQQLLREIPSAVNVKQFFLAISNNIPMFTDALMRYNKGIPEIKVKMAGVQAEIAKLNAELATMNVQTAEYEAKLVQINALKKQEIELQNASVGGWRAILKSVGSWQTMVIVGLVLLQKYGTKIIDLIKNIGKGIKDLTNQINLSAERFSILVEAGKNMSQVATELDIVLGRLKNIDQGTQEWVDGVETINNLTGQHVNALDTEIGKLSEMVEKYKEMARVMEVNKIVTSKLADAEVRSNIYHSLFYDSNASGDELMRRRYDADYIQKTLSGFVTDDQMKQIQGLIKNAHSELADTREKARKDLDELYYKYILITSEQQQMWKDMYQIVDPNLGKPVKEPKTPKDPRVNGGFNNSYNPVTMADVLVEEANAMRDKGGDVLAEIQLWYDKKVAIAEATYTKQKEVLQREKTDRERSLTENLNNARIFVAKYDDILAQLDKDHAAGNLDDDEYAAQKAKLEDQLKEATALIESEKEQRQNITDYYNQQEIIAEQKKNNELADLDQQRTDKLIKEEQKRFKEHQDAEKRRFELEKHNSIERAKFDMEQEIASKQWQIDHAKELELSEAELAILKEEVEWLNKKYNQGNYNAKRGNTGNYSNIMDVLFGEKITNDQISALNSVFDQAKEALNSWMDARKAAADQAKELADDEVSAAENALNREIELRNQGYANDVALKERELADAKERQKKAAELQKKAEKDALAVNTAMEASSMAVAIANLFKEFPLYAAIPLTAVLLGSFAAAKVQSFQAINSTKYRDGGYMFLEGGSHQSGNDISLGIGPDGSDLRAEGDEFFSVINKPNTRKYRSELPGIVNALNSGMFEDRYIKTSDAVGLLPRIIRADDGSTVDLSAVESGVGQLVKQGERSWSTDGEYRVMRYKNLTRRVRIGG